RDRVPERLHAGDVAYCIDSEERQAPERRQGLPRLPALEARAKAAGQGDALLHPRRCRGRGHRLGIDQGAGRDVEAASGRTVAARLPRPGEATGVPQAVAASARDEVAVGRGSGGRVAVILLAATAILAPLV